MGMISNLGGWLSGLKAEYWGPKINPGGTTAYTASSGLSQELSAFWPVLSSGDSATLPNTRIALDRTRDLIRNDPHASAAVMRLVDMLVGDGWTLISTPDARALGITPEQARELGRQIQTEWKLFSRNKRRLCDARRRLSMNGLFRLAARTYVTAGEATAVLKWNPESFKGRYRTSVAMIDPDRLYNRNNGPDTLDMRGGVQFDATGAPVGYWVRNGHLADWWAPQKAMTWEYVPKETSWGRPVFVHAFEPEREDQTRAITPFASLVSRLKMIGKFADTELAAATANALFAAFVESDLPADEIAQRLAPGGKEANARASWTDRIVNHYEKNPARLGGVRIPVMLPGSKVTMNGTPRQTTAFPAFQTAFLRSIASQRGLSYEQLSMDWSQTNYSSARAALNEVWRMMKRLQAEFCEQLVEPIYLAFLEEAFDKGFVKAPAGCPDFWDLPEGWAAARWVGPGRGYIDPTKEAEASALRMESMTSTLQDESAEQGKDYEETLDQIEREEEDLKARGLTRLSLVAAIQANKGAKPDSEEATGPAGPAGEKIAPEDQRPADEKKKVQK